MFPEDPPTLYYGSSYTTETPVYTATSGHTLSGSGSISINSGTLSGNTFTWGSTTGSGINGATTITGTGTPSTNGQYHMFQGAPDTKALMIQLIGGQLKIHYDGRIELPDVPMDEVAREFWDFVEKTARDGIAKQIREQAAQLVREVLPTLVDLDDYQLATLPHAVAMAQTLKKP